LSEFTAVITVMREEEPADVGLRAAEVRLS
jgi:hypothetical protein